MIFLLAFLLLAKEGQPQYSNHQLIRQLYNNKAYVEQKNRIVSQFKSASPGHWGEFVKGVDEDIVTSSKVIAFTFDGCGGGRKGNRYNKSLIEYLRAEKVPATLFVTGLWIDANPRTFLQLAKDTLFEIENHGFRHRPCAVKGESEYGIKGTANPADAYDEMEANAIKIEKLTGRKPKFYRSATAFTDEAGVRIASKLGITVISYDILSGDAVPGTRAQEIVRNVVENAKPGAIIIMHFNHPESNLLEAMHKIVPQLRGMGYRFVKLEGLPLKGKQPRQRTAKEEGKQ
jgi:Predicted xylanase/chitin deacetylase